MSGRRGADHSQVEALIRSDDREAARQADRASRQLLKAAIEVQLAEGYSVRGIARTLGCTRRYVYTVKREVSNRVDTKSTREKENE